MIVETYKNKDETIHKFIHDSGAETTIKQVASCVPHVDNDKIVIDEVDRNKASVFLSMSVGCQQNCKFCFLTAKKFHYMHLTDEEIIENTIEAIEAIDITDKYLKLSFMGMGDAFCVGNNIYRIATKILILAINYKLIKGLDGIDIGTSFPRVLNRNTDIVNQIGMLTEWIDVRDVKMNPIHKYTDTSEPGRNHIYRTPVRLFISLHGVDDKTRKSIMPKTDDLFNILLFITDHLSFIDKIFHYVCLDDINDSDGQINKLVKIFEGNLFWNHELRILRYNKCTGSLFNESKRFDSIIKKLSESNVKFKYQLSPGNEIKASCGQFVCRDFNV